MESGNLPQEQGLYNPHYEHDACGIGFVVNKKGRKSNNILLQGLEMLVRLKHRGGCGAEENTGDGAGILLQIPDKLFQSTCSQQNISLPVEGKYGVGMFFLPHDGESRHRIGQDLQAVAEEEGLFVLGWRDVPIDHSTLGLSSKKVCPHIKQVFIESALETTDTEFERKLYVLRKQMDRKVSPLGGYIASLSSRTIVYKGMLTPEQLPEFYLDLQSPLVETALSMVHSRFSTNTFPSWERAHPNRLLAHNGEINTLRGNVNWMKARERLLAGGAYGEEWSKLTPILDENGSDSAMLDNCLEFLAFGGYDLPHAISMMIPEPWSKNKQISSEKAAFYEYHSCLMEPWDGPTAVAFTDGIVVGAVLDRNGLRPFRYYVMNDDTVVVSSEVGVIDVDDEQVLAKGRLQPGGMLLVDTTQGELIADEEIKNSLARQRPYGDWLEEHLIDIDSLPPAPYELSGRQGKLVQRQLLFGYGQEDVNLILKDMANDGVEPLGSMGTDIPLAVLSDRPQLLYNYFKQLFAQVTNPPIDAMREELVIGTEVMLGSEGNLLQPNATDCRKIRLSTPILTNQQLSKLRYITKEGFRSKTLSILFDKKHGESGLEKAMDQLFADVDVAVATGVNLVILSDKGSDGEQVPIPALLAVAGVHHHLIREGTRTQVDLILESGEPRETHHMALLLGYGVGAINPYLAYETIADLANRGELVATDPAKALINYGKALVKGIVKIMSKMGISTVQSYRGAQIFEALGIGQSVIDKFFTGTASRIGGIDLNIIAKEALLRHDQAVHSVQNFLESAGEYQWRKTGEEHLYNPHTIFSLQQACRANDYDLYKEFSRRINDQSDKLRTLRGLMDFKTTEPPIDLVEVESIDSIVRRFKTGAMSFGSISKEAHECLAIAMNRLGAKSNTGEGGEDPLRFIPDSNGDSRCSAIKQVASGRFGVTSEYLVSAKEIQIKIAQGAKPGEGGQLPGKKVYPWVAKVRHSTPGVGLISPPPHHDIYSIEDLAQLIHDLKNANPDARISVKLVSAVGVGTIAAGVAKGLADVVAISGYDGGTGASSRSSIRHTGLPWELGLSETNQTLVLNNLRDRITVETDGKLMTGRDVAIAALLGAEEFAFATAPLVALGCVMMRACQKDTCPVGIATQNPELRKHFSGAPEHVVNLMRFIAQELREIMASLGFRTLNQMVGRVDKLIPRSVDHWKAKFLDLSNILYQPTVNRCSRRYKSISQDHHLEKALDNELIRICKLALQQGAQVERVFQIKNTNRVVGTMLGSWITKNYGARGLSADTIRLTFTGSAGQSFGSFTPPGLTLTVEGDANDYVGKGLSGAKIIVRPPQHVSYKAEENMAIGNVAFYGATAGEAYIRGLAGERFCVRNSGMKAVVEGVGDHGCEYMTGGRVVVLGAVGKNFAAGMSGGVAYVWDPKSNLAKLCNTYMVLLERLTDEEDQKELVQLILSHYTYTDSEVAKGILDNWIQSVTHFVKVIPKDYKRMLIAFKRLEARGISREEAVMQAFTENSQDLARVGGN